MEFWNYFDIFSLVCLAPDSHASSALLFFFLVSIDLLLIGLSSRLGALNCTILGLGCKVEDWGLGFGVATVGSWGFRFGGSGGCLRGTLESNLSQSLVLHSSLSDNSITPCRSWKAVGWLPFRYWVSAVPGNLLSGINIFFSFSGPCCPLPKPLAA